MTFVKTSTHYRAVNNTKKYNDFLDELKSILGAPDYTAKWKDGTTRIKWFYFGHKSNKIQNDALSFIEGHKKYGIKARRAQPSYGSYMGEILGNKRVGNGLNVYVPAKYRFKK